MYTLGIDLHKKSSVWILIDKQRTELWKEDVLCDPIHISTALQNMPVLAKEVSVAIEPVCGWRWVTAQLSEAGMDVHIAHPRKVQLIAQSKKKTDTEDARTLANLLHSGFFPEAHKTSEGIYNLRLLLRERAYLIRLRTSAKNQIHGIATTQGLHHILGGNPLQKKGKTGIMASENFVLKELHTLVENFDTRIVPFDLRLEEELKKYPLAHILMSMPGLGIITALTVIAEVDNFSRFKTAKHLTSFAGLVPRQRSSGEVVRYGAITHQGSKQLRTAIVELAMRIRKSNAPELFAFVERLAPICGAKKARIALGRKMLAILWKMAVTQTSYSAPTILRSPCAMKVSDLDTGAGA